MRAAIYHDIQDVSIEEIPDLRCGARDVLVRNVRAGICGSDVTGYFKGGKYAGIYEDRQFGHENAGRIVEVGKDVEGFGVGDKVFVNPNRAIAPGEGDMLGAFSEYILVPNAEANYNIFLLPENMSYDVAVLIEPFSVGIHGYNVAGVKPDDHVVVYGVGTIGISSICGLLAKGIKPVAMVRSNAKREFLERAGAIVCNINEVDRFEFLRETFGTTLHRNRYPAIDVDLVIDAAGGPEIVADFLQMCKPKSKLSVLAVVFEPFPVPMARLMSSETIIMGSCGFNEEDVLEAIDNLTSGKTLMPGIITSHYKLDQINEAIVMAQNREKSIKVLIDME
ncbi:MAG: alcohol dehydrogenase catalytic domain-containing protein [Coriobacteriales bacterium]|jgi:threonine dehydrogenase-like Zn-dependent dehydrogenase|nr:alcohol dehydrogenase catalytic domain-containing protein [Coriobacteriales bacterium]